MKSISPKDGKKGRGLDSWPGEFLILPVMLEASIKEHPLCSVRQVSLYPQYSRGCKAITHTVFQQQTMIDNVKGHTEKQPPIFLSSISISQLSVICVSAVLVECPSLQACWKFVINLFTVKSIVSGQTIFSKSLLRVGNRLIGRLFEAIKGPLLFLGSEITLATLQAWRHTLSSRLKLKT